MRYVGGKTRLAKKIACIIEQYRNGRSIYIEPFLGGGSVFEAVSPAFEHVMAGDAHRDLIDMYEAARLGWNPPTTVTEQEYYILRNNRPSPERGFAGFACSFGGKWFGGYARSGDRNFAAAGSRIVTRTATKMENAILRCVEYNQWKVNENCVVYCDPPYKNTQGYSVGTFNHEAFWNKALEWTEQGALVLVSEYSAPEGWNAVLEHKRRGHLAGGCEDRIKTEKVFRHG